MVKITLEEFYKSIKLKLRIKEGREIQRVSWKLCRKSWDSWLIDWNEYSIKSDYIHDYSNEISKCQMSQLRFFEVFFWLQIHL